VSTPPGAPIAARSMGRNARLVLVAKTARTFCYGFLGVLFPVYLTRLGIEAGGLGIAVTLTLLASAAMTFGVRRPAERYGPRVVLMAQAGLIVLSAALFLLSREPWVVVAAAMLGNLAVGTGETGPFLSLEQVVVTRDTPNDRLNTALSLYNFMGYAAAGLGASAVGQAAASPSLLFGTFLVSGLTQLVAYGLMRAERPRVTSHAARADAPSRSLVRRLAALFALDSLAGGFVLQSLIAYWFFARFGAGLQELGWIFFGTQLLSGLSLLLAARIAPRLGLVNTMVFSHLISNLLLIGVGFAPTLGLAAAFLLARHLLSQMDVPTRQTFLMLAVEDHEREAAASLTNTSRTLAQAVSPTVAGWAMQGIALGAPLLLGGGLKIAYDLALYATIRNVRAANL
jgi:MFS family permease